MPLWTLDVHESTLHDVAVEVGVRELRENLSEWLDRAAGGEDVIVTERGKPKVRLAAATGEHILDKLVREGRAGLRGGHGESCRHRYPVKGQPGDGRTARAASGEGVLTLYIRRRRQFTKLFLAEEGSTPSTAGCGSLRRPARLVVRSPTRRRARHSHLHVARDRLSRTCIDGRVPCGPSRRTSGMSSRRHSTSTSRCDTVQRGSLAMRHRLARYGLRSISHRRCTVAAARPSVVTWDAELRRAASAEGLAVSV